MRFQWPLAIGLICSCGHVKAVEAGVHVDADNCKEAPLTPQSHPDRTVLDCVSGGDVTVRIELARAVWNTIRASDAGALASSSNAPSLSIDGARCRENVRDHAASETALLDCEGESDGGRVSFIVALGRQEWRAIKARTRPGPFEAGPGK